jgi:hypothetical protein
MQEPAAIFIILCLIAAFYLFPSLVAWSRGHHNGASVFVVNLLLGWTLLGWVIAMAWSVSAVRSDK